MLHAALLISVNYPLKVKLHPLTKVRNFISLRQNRNRGLFLSGVNEVLTKKIIWWYYSVYTFYTGESSEMHKSVNIIRLKYVSNVQRFSSSNFTFRKHGCNDKICTSLI